MISCGNKITQGFQQRMLQQDETVNDYFSNPQKDYVYKMRMEVYGRFFGGILIIKRLDENQHRMVMTSEFGSKIFDFSFINGEFSKDYIMEDLDKKLLIKTLEQDLGILIRERSEASRAFESGKDLVIRSPWENKYTYYYSELGDSALNKIMLASWRKPKMEIRFVEKTKGQAEFIEIHHFNMKLDMELKYLVKE